MKETKGKGKKAGAEADEDILAQLDAGYQREPGSSKISLPRLAMVSQDKTEGKGKAMKVVVEAGTFFFERESDELDADGKKKWEKEEIGDEVAEAIVFFRRYQLRYFDEATEEFTSSPIYDSADEVVPLFRNGKEVARGTPAQLRSRKEFAYVDKKDGKTKSNLEEQRVLYVLVDGEAYQMNLRGSSMYAWLRYERNNPSVASTVTRLSSEPKEKGTIAWNQMTFEAVRRVNAEEAKLALERTNEMRALVAASKAQFAAPALGAGEEAEEEEEEEDIDEVVESLSAGKTKSGKGF